MKILDPAAFVSVSDLDSPLFGDGAGPTHLTARDRVLARDLWNKFLAHDGMLAHLFFERLMTIAPKAGERFGQAAWRAPYVYLRLLDLGARCLAPATEKPLREGYSVAPSARRSRCDTQQECIAFLCALDLPREIHEKAVEAFVWTCTKIPAAESFDQDDLRQGTTSAAGKFFRACVVEPVAKAGAAKDALLSPRMAERMRRGVDRLVGRRLEAGSFFYGELFRAYPGAMHHFRTSDMDQMSRHLVDTVVLLSEIASDPERIRSELIPLAAVHLNYRIPAAEYPHLTQPLLNTLEAFGEAMDEDVRTGWLTLFDQAVRLIAEPMVMHEWLVGEAHSFLEQVATELAWTPERLAARTDEVTREIEVSGAYTHTFDELETGAKLAWRNAGKCIGRISWKNLLLRDCRHASDAETVFRECVEHLRAATNGGNIEIVLSAFRPQGPKERWGPRIWNSQLVRYAGYEREDGSVLGDGANVELTEAITTLGWHPPEPRGPYDILPLVVDMPGEAPRIFEIDPAEVAEVEIAHPTEPGIAELGMKWCAVPAITNFNLELGGLRYSCVPFNGWFMGTEIARNLWEEPRYGRAEEIAAALGLDTSSEMTLWRDRAFVELNVAILHSFQEARVTLVDHHTASRQFLYHDIREKNAGRECPAQWSWIAPSAGGSTTPVWHHEMRDFQLSPSFEYEADRWLAQSAPAGCPVARKGAPGPQGRRNRRPLILFASETGTAEAYARQIGRRLAHLGPQIRAMDDVPPGGLRDETRVLFVVSTCRDGDLPENGRAFVEALDAEQGQLEGVRYAVLGMGNRIYAKFCAAAIEVDRVMDRAGAERLAAVECADEIAGQGDTVQRWTAVFDKMWSIDGPTFKPRRKLVEVIPPRQPRPADSKEIGRVHSNEELLDYSDGRIPRALRSTRRITIDLPPRRDEGASGRYAPGDHLAIHPVNPEALVERVCRHLDLPVETWFKLHGSLDPSYDTYRQGYPLRRLLGETLDLTLPDPPEELLGAMEEASRDPEDKQALGDLLRRLDRGAGATERTETLRMLRRRYHDIADLFDAFDRSVPGLEVLIELLPGLKPRYYSVASSPLVAPDRVTIVAGLLTRQEEDGRHLCGICSHYLADLSRGAELRIALKPTPRRLPEDRHAPLLLVAAGTGIAPIIGLLEDRAARAADTDPDNPIALYFGCRSEGEFLYRDRILTWLRQGRLSRLSTAFSRESASKAYVQDALDADSVAVWADLCRPDAHVMVAGDAKMSRDVSDKLGVIAQREGGLTEPQARQFFDDMREEGRLVEDIWGLQLNHDLARSEMLAMKYDSGANWFSRLQRTFSREPVVSPAIRRY